MHFITLTIHVVAGSLALLAGGAALAMPKGGRLHRRSGTLFFAAMAVMTVTGSMVAIARPERTTAVIGLLTLYLVVTSWMAARRRDGIAAGFERAGFAFAATGALVFTIMGAAASASPTGRLDELPAAVPFGFGALAALAAMLDLNFILRGQLSQAQRIARHLWRMCAALLIATTSFFFGQQDELPSWVQGSPVLALPTLMTLAAMISWIFRVRFGRQYRRPVPGASSSVAAVGVGAWGRSVWP